MVVERVLILHQQIRITRLGAPYDDCIDHTVRNISRDVYEEMYPEVTYSELASLQECCFSFIAMC